MARNHVLDGIKVLDFTQWIAGPVASRLMAEMGAEVVKVEFAPNGDQARAVPFVKDGRSAYFAQHNQGKKGICLNLREPRAKDLILRMLPEFDVLIENFSPGTIGRLGLDWPTVHAANPDLIMCSISAFGQTGPLAELPGFDFIAQGYTGVTSMIGEPDQAPPLTGVPVGDVGTGISALAAINAALYHRAVEGKDEGGGGGQFLDLALIDFYFLTHGISVEAYTASGGELVADRNGSHHQHIAPVGIFAGPSGFITILCVSPDMWRRLIEAMAMPELLDDPRFADGPARLANKVALQGIIENWLAGFEDNQAAVSRLHRSRVPAAPVLSVAEAIEDPHLVQRGTVREVEDPGLGRFKIPGTPLHFSAFPDAIPHRAPYLGEHNADVLTRYLGCTGEEIAGLEADGVLVREPLPTGAAAE